MRAPLATLGAGGADIVAVPRFPSKVDTWLVVLTSIGPAIGLAVVWTAVIRGGTEAWLAVVIVTVSTGFVMWIFLSTYYEIGEGQLVARSGPFTFRRPLGSLSRVRATRTWLSSPALSFDRIEVQGSAGSLVISPREKAAFLEALQAAAPQVRLDDTLTTLIRQPALPPKDLR